MDCSPSHHGDLNIQPSINTTFTNDTHVTAFFAKSFFLSQQLGSFASATYHSFGFSTTCFPLTNPSLSATEYLILFLFL